MTTLEDPRRAMAMPNRVPIRQKSTAATGSMPDPPCVGELVTMRCATTPWTMDTAHASMTKPTAT